MKLLIIFAFVTVVTCVHVKLESDKQLETSDISKNNYIFSQSKSSTFFGFKHVFVNATGEVSYERGVLGTQIRITGSPGTTYNTLHTASTIVLKMTRYMPTNIFTNIAVSTYIGVFSKAEKITVFPEFKMFDNGDCGTRCDGSCARTCYLPGKKYENMSGLSREISVVLDDNVMCSANDPMKHQSSVLAHEFAHAVHRFGLTSNTSTQIKDAYKSAKSNRIWNVNSSDMTSDLEYFATSATVFFSVDLKAEMNVCDKGPCISEEEGRQHLQAVDPVLFNLVSYVFTDGRPKMPSALTICPAHQSFVE